MDSSSFFRPGRLILLAASLGLSCTEPPPGSIDCTQEGAVLGSVLTGPTTQLVGEDLQVTGTAWHEAGLAIRKVTVAGVAASNDRFNFSSWSVTVPLETLASLPLSGGNAEVQVLVEATDACENAYTVASFPLLVDRQPGVTVERLGLSAEIPGGLDWLPADGTTTALLEIVANPTAAGAQVTLSSTAGGQFSGLDGSDQVLLGGDRVGDARATVFFSSDRPGSVLITATAEDQTSLLPLTVAGPPELTPPAATLLPGQRLRVTVSSEGELRSCQAAPTAGISVTSGGVNLMAMPGGTDISGDGQIDIDLVVEATLAESTSLLLSCQDLYGQSATGQYDLDLP